MNGPDYDAIVVGAGHNGLVTANLLADAGSSVLVLEADDVPGGAVRSAEVLGPGFITDLFSAFYPLGAASPVLRALRPAGRERTRRRRRCCTPAAPGYAAAIRLALGRMYSAPDRGILPPPLRPA